MCILQLLGIVFYKCRLDWIGCSKSSLLPLFTFVLSITEKEMSKSLVIVSLSVNLVMPKKYKKKKTAVYWVPTHDSLGKENEGKMCN